MEIATAAQVAAALGVRLKANGWTPCKALCHAARSDTSLRFRDADTTGGSLAVKCWSGCDALDARHALQAATGLPLCRCAACFEADRAARPKPVPRTAQPLAPPTTPQRAHTTREDARRRWARGLPIPQAAAHPARRWLAGTGDHGPLWRPELQLPAAVRWLPASRRDTPHVGQVMLLLAPLEEWAAAWPQLPATAAVQVVAVDAGGLQVCDLPPEAVDGRGRPLGQNKRSIGEPSGTVGLLGDPRPATAFGLYGCEGLADALALASRFPDTAMATAGTSGLAGLAAHPAALGVLARWPAVGLWADQDDAGKARARALAGKVNARRPGLVEVRHLQEGKDPASAAKAFAPLDWAQVHDAAAAYAEAADLPAWEALRWATTT